MAFLHCHYSDCLISLLRSSRRGTPQSGADFEAQVLGALGVIRRFNVITRKYVRTLDLTQAPFRPKKALIQSPFPRSWMTMVASDTFPLAPAAILMSCILYKLPVENQHAFARCFYAQD